jgi:branched-chain amino acid transport system substrate-binding protein
MVIDTPMNKKFIELWKKEYGEIKEPIISEANDTWNAVMLWAEGAKKAGSADPEKVIDAIETGIDLESPEGKIKMLPGSHHFVHNVYIVAGDDKHNFEVIEEHKNVLPEYEQQVCDLKKNPKTSKQFVPEL